MMRMLLLMNMKNDCYLDDDDGDDDAEVEDLICYIFTISCKRNSVGVNAPNWIFTHLKCIANAPYFICIVMHFL